MGRELFLERQMRNLLPLGISEAMAIKEIIITCLLCCGGGGGGGVVRRE